jgi:hypothetical protein
MQQGSTIIMLSHHITQISCVHNSIYSYSTYAISVYHHWSCEFESCSWRGVLDTTLCDQFCQWLSTDRWFSLGTPVSFTSKAGRHDITEILLKVALSTITLTPFILHVLTFFFWIVWNSRSSIYSLLNGINGRFHIKFDLH